MVKLLRGGIHHPRGGNQPQHGRGFPRFPIQPPPMMDQHNMPLSREHFQRHPPPYRHSLPFSRGRPFLGPPPQFSQHPIPPPRMGPLTPRAELPIYFNGRSYPPRPMLPHYSMPPGPFRGNLPPHRLPYKIGEELSITKSVPVKRLGVVNDKTKQKQRRKPKIKERSEGLFYCEACDRGWDIKEALDNHNSQHMTCGVEGCTLSAHPKVIEKHIQQQHVTGLYKRITASYNPADVAKWLTERKSRFPTQENIEKKQAQKEEMLARGESMPQNDHFNRANGGRGRRQFSNRGRGGRKRRHQNMRRNQKNEVIETININNNSQAQDNPPGFQFCKTDKSWGDCWRGDLPQFPGTAAFPKIKEEVISTVKEEQFSDDEWKNSEDKEIIVEPLIKSQALASLCGMYASGSDDDDVEQPPPAKKHKSFITKTDEQVIDSDSNDKNSFVENNIENKQATHVNKSSNEFGITIKDEDNSDSAPEEVPITHEDSFENNDAISKEVVKDSLENSKKIPEDNVVINHESSEQKMVSEKKLEHCTNEVNSKKGVAHFNTRFSQRRKRLTLLEKLLSREITHERNVILQCVRYVIQNNFLSER